MPEKLRCLIGCTQNPRQLAKTEVNQDKRFSSDEWVNHPIFNLLSQQYLLATKHLKSLLDTHNTPGADVHPFRFKP